jgi:hypothetical protein
MYRRDFTKLILASGAAASLGTPLYAKCRWCGIVGADLGGALVGAGTGAAIAGVGAIPGGILGAGAASFKAAADMKEPEPVSGPNPNNPYDMVGSVHNQIIAGYASKVGKQYDRAKFLEFAIQGAKQLSKINPEQGMKLMAQSESAGDKAAGLSGAGLGKFCASLLPKGADQGRFAEEVEKIMSGDSVVERHKMAIEVEAGYLSQAKSVPGQVILSSLSVLRYSDAMWNRGG